MNDLTRVDSRDLRAAQPMVAGAASALEATLGRLADGLDAEGTCWGTDATGQAFAASYVPAMRTVRKAFVDLQAAVGSIASSLLTVADNANSVDAAAAGRLG